MRPLRGAVVQSLKVRQIFLVWVGAHQGIKAIEAWHNSPPHLENIMNCHYTKFGTGVAQSPDGKIWYTMLFEGNASC